MNSIRQLIERRKIETRLFFFFFFIRSNRILPRENTHQFQRKRYALVGRSKSRTRNRVNISNNISYAGSESYISGYCFNWMDSNRGAAMWRTGNRGKAIRLCKTSKNITISTGEIESLERTSSTVCA